MTAFPNIWQYRPSRRHVLSSLLALGFGQSVLASLGVLDWLELGRSRPLPTKDGYVIVFGWVLRPDDLLGDEGTE